MESFEISADSYDPSSLTDNNYRSRSQNPSASRPAGPKAEEKPRTAAHQHNNTAASTAKPADKSAETAKRTDRISTRRRWKLFAGIALIVFAAYMLIVCISYFSTGADDQSIVQGRQFASISAEPEAVSNTGGPLGAFLADMLLSQWLGIGSFILIYYVGALGVSLAGIRHMKFWDLTYKCLLTSITLSILTGFVTYSMTSHNFWGGNHGHMVNEFLIANTGWWGAIGVNMILVAAVVLVFLRELQTAYDAYRTKVREHRERVARERAATEARRRQMEAMMATDEPAASPAPAEPIPSGQSREETSAASEPIQTEDAVRDDPYAPVAATRSEKMDLTDIVTPPSTQPEREETDCPTVSLPVNNDRNNDREAFIPGIVTPEEAPTEADVREKETQEPSSVQEKQPISEENDVDTAASVQLTEIPTVKEEPAAIADDTEVSMTVNTPQAVTEARHISSEPYDPTAELSHYRFPSIDLLEKRTQRTDHVDIAEQEENKERLTQTLNTFGVKISHIEATVGPTITRYEIIPEAGTRTRSVKTLGEDLQLSLAALGIRIIAPVPGKGTIGIEVPNKDPQIVSIRSILSSEAFQSSQAELPIAMGSTITNDVYVADLAKLPHLLVAGATGMGKSVGLNTIIASLLFKKHPAELKFVLIDPKRVELSLYRKLERHYLAALPGEDAIITDTSKVVSVLNSLCIEMENRLELLKKAEVRNIKEYNEKFVARRLNPNEHKFMPYIVLIIDEFADIILTAGKEVENPVSRLAAVARAAGIHLIIATQRPSVTVITGAIKTNIPGRIAFRVNQGVDSRTILDQVGANQLIGKGDMLFSCNGSIERVQCAFIDTDEVKAICDSIADQIGYSEPYQLPEFVPPTAEGSIRTGAQLGERDPMFKEAGMMVVETQSGSTTNLQRKLAIGFGRAGRIMDQLEAAGVVGPAQGGKPRPVLMDIMAFENYLQLNAIN